MKHNLKIGDKVYASDWCYGTIVDIDLAQNQVLVEFETSGGGGTTSFAVEDVRPEKQDASVKNNLLENIVNIIAGVTEKMDANAPCNSKKPMRPAYCKECRFNESRIHNLGYSCEAYNKAKALIDAGMCIRSDLVDQIFADIEVAMALTLVPAHVRGVIDVPEYYEGDLTEAIANIKEKYRGEKKDG